MTELSEPTTEMIYRARVDAPVVPARLAVYEVRTADMERLVHYYEDSLGLVTTERSESAAYLTTAGDHHCVVISAGEPDARARLGFEISGSLEDTEQRLSAAGIAPQRRTDPEPGVAADLVIAEYGTGVPLTLCERQVPSGTPAVISGRPSKLGHVASYVTDLAGSQRFYLEVMGLRFSDMIGDFFTFLRCNADHHAINLMQSQKKSGLFHVAFEMRDMLHLKDQLDLLSTRGHELIWGPGRHGVGHNIFTYHRDPDGNIVELFTEIDLIFDEESEHFEPRPWHEEWPQGPKVWPPHPGAANKWGIINPDMMDH
jgi:catechol 2,3-dioxygenase-like lactoylglutathione lyase family enzyme